jgi:hypothetical protein
MAKGWHGGVLGLGAALLILLLEVLLGRQARLA